MQERSTWLKILQICGTSSAAPRKQAFQIQNSIEIQDFSSQTTHQHDRRGGQHLKDIQGEISAALWQHFGSILAAFWQHFGCNHKI